MWSIFILVGIVVHALNAEGMVTQTPGKNEPVKNTRNNETVFGSKSFNGTNSTRPENKTVFLKDTIHLTGQGGEKQDGPHHTLREDEDRYSVIWCLGFFLAALILLKIFQWSLDLPCCEKLCDTMDEAYRRNYEDSDNSTDRREPVVRFSRGSRHVFIESMRAENMAPIHSPRATKGVGRMEQEGRLAELGIGAQVNSEGYTRLIDEID